MAISIPNVDIDGSQPLVGRKRKLDSEQLEAEISALIENIGSVSLLEEQQAFLRSVIYAHYHPELKIGTRVQIYQGVKHALMDENLNKLKNIAGIREKSAYINAISNVGKRSSYFGGLIGVSVVGLFFLPPVIKFGIIPVAKSAVRRFVPKQTYLIPIDKNLKLSKVVGKDPAKIYSAICKSLGFATRKAGKPVPANIDTTPMDDLIGNLFFRALLEESTFNASAKEDLRARAQIAFLYDMARVSRQLEGLARDPALSWERISNYTNFSMFLKSMESKEVPILQMLTNAVEIISRANIGGKKRDARFYTEFERGLKNLNYILQVVEPLDRFNEQDAFDDLESQQAKLAFFEQNRLVMERLYIGHELALREVRPMFVEFEDAARKTPPKSAKTDEEKYKFFQNQTKKIIGAYRKSFKVLGKAELVSYNEELARL